MRVCTRLIQFCCITAILGGCARQAASPTMEASEAPITDASSVVDTIGNMIAERFGDHFKEAALIADAAYEYRLEHQTWPPTIEALLAHLHEHSLSKITITDMRERNDDLVIDYEGVDIRGTMTLPPVEA